ncbi:AfsR/SARP family transcriptional regulator [Allokutzneria oryzae]|uniref:Bacterial transcriptional activator domain-containing protein n=1 Tax=Allokutzneria oryzae TaxID=1378989 RepID=A0ABV5ZS35_9PSEU
MTTPIAAVRIGHESESDPREVRVCLVEFRLFGGVEAVVRGAGLPLGHARRSCCSSRSTEWFQYPRCWTTRGARTRRASPHETLRSHLSRLHSTLTPAGITITRADAGYRLAAPAHTVDLHAFRALMAAAHSAEEPLPLLEQTLAVWRGNEPFAGLTACGLDDLPAPLAQERRCVELDRGRHNELLPELVTGATAAPLAGHRLDRQADALTRYQQHGALAAEPSSRLPSTPAKRLRVAH